MDDLVIELEYFNWILFSTLTDLAEGAAIYAVGLAAFWLIVG